MAEHFELITVNFEENFSKNQVLLLRKRRNKAIGLNKGDISVMHYGK